MICETFSVLVENRFGVLARVSGLFSGRGYNIHSLTVSPTENPEYSRMTIVTYGDSDVLEQIEKQVTKLIEVVKVTRLTQGNFIVSELMLIQIRAIDDQSREAVMQLAEKYGAKLIRQLTGSLAFRLTKSSAELDAFVKEATPFGILELARTGSVALS